MEGRELLQLYARIPSAACGQCGSCCKKFKPAFGAAEFRFFYSLIQNKYSQDEIVKLLDDSANPAACSFLGGDNLCLVWEFRPFACRIFGLEIEHQGKILSDYSSRCAGKPQRRRISLFAINTLYKELDKINQEVLSVKPSFYIRALTFETWTSIYLDKDFDITSGFGQLKSAQKLFEAGEYQKALLEYTLLRTNNPDDFAIEESLFNTALCLEKLGNLKQAKEAFETVYYKTLFRDDKMAGQAEEKIKCLNSQGF